jgi:hypothetical protein
MEKSNLELLKENVMYGEFREALEDEVEDVDSFIENSTPKELLDRYFEYNGIIGFTDMILSAVTTFIPDSDPVDFELDY